MGAVPDSCHARSSTPRSIVDAAKVRPTVLEETALDGAPMSAWLGATVLDRHPDFAASLDLFDIDAFAAVKSFYIRRAHPH